MSLIGNVTLITVTGRFVDLQDQPLSGQVSFTPSTPGPLINAQGQVIVGNGAVTATLDATGSFVVALPASDDPNLNPRNFTYRVSEPQASGRSYNITVPRGTSGGILDLYTVAPGSDASPGVVQAVTGTSVTQGIVDPQGHLILTFSDGTTQDAGSVVTGGIDLTNYYTKTQADQAIATATSNLVVTTDARLSNARTPTAHAASHRSGGSDAVALDQLAAPAGAVNVNGQRITNAADPTSAQDVATRAFVLANAGAGGGGGGTGLGAIQTATDYDNSNAATDGQAIVWSGASSKFAPGTVVADADLRLTNARTPTAHAASHGSGGSDPVTPSAIGAAATSHAHAAGDVTSGTLALARIPTGTTTSTVALGSHAHSGADVTSGTVGYARLPVGTTAGSTVCDGGDARLSNARTPLSHSHAGADITSGTVAYARLPVGTAASTVAAGNDARLTNARTPTTHGDTHASSGSDPAPAAINYALTMPTAYTNVTAAYNAPAQVGSTLNIPDPGFPYVLQVAGMIVTRSGASANQRTDLSLRLGSITGTEIVHVTGNPALGGGTFIQVPLTGAWPQTGKLTGATSLLLGAGVFPTGATGQVGGQSGFDAGNFLTVTVIPA